MNKAELKQLAFDHGLDIMESSIKINETGVDFRVAHAEDSNGNEWILRAPRRLESMRNAQQEKEALDIINKQADFQVPYWSIFSEDLIAYQQLSGVPAATADIEEQKYVWSFDEKNIPDEYYESLGKTLAQLHSINPHKLKKTGIEVLSADELRATMEQRMNRVKEKYFVNEDLWGRWQSWLVEDSYWPPFTGVKHGDLHPGHIIIDKSNYVTGLIDWSEVGVGDVSVDFLAHQLIFGKEGLEKLIHAYSSAGGETWARMDEHIVELLTTNAITIAEYAETSGLKEMEEAAANMLANEY